MNPLLFHVLDLLAKSADVVLLAFAVQSLWRGASAAQRSSVWLAAFLVLLLLPLTLLWQPRWSFDFAHRETQQTLLPQPGLIVAGQASASFAAQALPSAPQPWFSSLSLVQGSAVLWLAGFAGLLARRALGSLQLRRLKSRSHAVEDARALAATARGSRPGRAVRCFAAGECQHQRAADLGLPPAGAAAALQRPGLG